MDNSRRNIIIVISIVIVACFCIGVVVLGLLGYLLPIERVVGFLNTNEVAQTTLPAATQIPTEIIIEVVPTHTEIPPSPTSGPTQAKPTEEVPASPTPIPIPPEIADQMDQIESQVIILRKLQPGGTFTRRLLTRDELRQKIENEFLEDYSPEEAKQDAIVLSAIGLLEPDFDIFNFYQELLSEQIAGQYDQKSQEMDIIQDTGFGGIERLTYAHEYTHALQDQNYDIENGLNYSDEACEQDSEGCAAVQALLEGDASLLELEWFTTYATAQDYNDFQDFYENLESPIYESAPDYLKEDFLFPYIYGQPFVEYLYNRGGWEAVNAAYHDLPDSTEQILHPDRYPDDVPIEVDLPDLSPVLGDGWQELDRNVMGEWYTYLILAHGRDPNARLDDTQAQNASQGWGGDTYLVYYNEQNDETVFVVKTLWESENDSQQFLDAFRKHSSDRFGSPTNSAGDGIQWTHSDGVTEFSIDGQYTTWILAPDEEIALLVREAIPSQ